MERMGRGIYGIYIFVEILKLISLINYNQVDFSKYNACIANSQFPTIYAESWYLDIVTNSNWDVLVFNDYEAVMPVPYVRLKRSFWKKSIVQPMFCQQLGVFYTTELMQEIFNAFYTEFIKLKPFVYQFNHTNNKFLRQQKEIKPRANYVLVLNKETNFNKNTKRNISKAKKNGLTISKSNNEQTFISFYQEHNPLPFGRKQKKVALDFIKTSLINNKGEIFQVEKEGEVVAKLFVLKHHKRMIYLMSVSNAEGQKNGAMHFLVNHLVETTKDCELLDFEGSDIEGVAKFFRGFGAEKQTYLIYK